MDVLLAHIWFGLGILRFGFDRLSLAALNDRLVCMTMR